MLANPLCCHDQPLAWGQRMHFGQIKRRQFITLLGGAAVTWPITARAQPAMPVIGFISPNLSRDGAQPFTAPFRQGLNEISLAEGRNVAIEEFHEDNRSDRLSAIAVELARRPVSLIAALGTVSALAAKAATTTVPIVFATGDDPIASGLVTSFNRPGGNITGVTFVSAGVAAKRLQLLHSLAPKVALMGVLGDQSSESQNQCLVNRKPRALSA
jgi:putative ABC transport system substrate-binding protein